MYYKNSVLWVYQIWGLRCLGLHIYNWGIISLIRHNSIHAAQSQLKQPFLRAHAINAQSIRWSTDGFTSSEPMRLSITWIVKTIIDNHTLDERNHPSHHTTSLVKDSVVRSPRKAVRRRRQELGICRESVKWVLITDAAKARHDNIRKRVIICQWFCDKIEDVWFFRRMTFSVGRLL